LHYVYPYPHVDDVIPLMAEGAILPYLDVPFQHASPRILKAMNRPASSENNLTRIKAWREVCPDITVRSTFIAGFPGETEDDFKMLLDFLEEAQLDRVGCFAYSDVDGAKANELPGQVPEEVKQERLSRFMEVQERISAAKLQSKVGSMQTVLVDELTTDDDDNVIAIARTKADAPEIDGVVYLQDADGLNPGDFVEVQILGADGHDLVGGPPQD
jgi:ribosomal protein S12 methylthiotransferase